MLATFLQLAIIRDMNLKKTTVCLSEMDRKKAEELMRTLNLTSLAQLVRYAIEYLSKKIE